MSVLKADLARQFIQSRSFKYNETKQFTLSSGELSPFYVDCKGLMGSPEARQLVAALAYENIIESGQEFDCIGGLEIGSIAIATSLSDYGFVKKPMKKWNTFVVRKMPKGHGLRNKIEGIAKPSEKALIVDDVLTTGGSVLQAVRSAREAGIEVTHALVIVNRDEKNGRQNLLDEGVELISLLSIHDLLDASQKAFTFA